MYIRCVAIFYRLVYIVVVCRLIAVNAADPQERALFSGMQKFMGIALTVFQAFMYVYSGVYGTIDVRFCL